MTGRTLIAAIVCLALAAPLFAGDIVAMPTGNFVQPKHLEFNGIWWKMPPAGTAGDIMIGEAFIGVADRVEVDVLDAYVRGPNTNVLEVNAYLNVVKETPDHPGLIVGCTNVMGASWLGGAKFGGPSSNDDPSFCVLTSYNLAAPEVPSFHDPLIRVHFGWGDNWHQSRLFGGVQFKVYPNFGGAILNYQGSPAYMLTWAPCKSWELTVGTLQGSTFFRVGAFTKF
jgi:hypothetical protein